MGTPPASGSLDQMRRIQLSLKGGGECARLWLLEKTCDSIANGITSATLAIAGMALTFCLPRPDLTSGWAGGPVRRGDVSQQARSAQHPGLHDISLLAFVAIQVAAGNPTVAATRASPTVKDAVSLLSMALVF